MTCIPVEIRHMVDSVANLLTALDRDQHYDR